ncbi:TPA: hypothetical protein HA251_08085 [Candidatus Woesearchaeota archaeon]|nr:hypothetical protein [Candidatus Woesearchaeota archaeon]
MVAFVAIVAILRSGSPLSFESDRGTLVGNAVANVVAEAPIVATKTVNNGQIVDVRIGDVDHELSNIIIDDGGVALFSIDGEVGPSIREGEIAIFTHKTLRLDSIKRKTIVPPCAPGGSSCPPPFTLVSAEVTITVYPDGVGAPRAGDVPPSYVTALRLSLGDEATYSFHGLDHTIRFDGINSGTTPYLFLLLDGQEIPLRFQGDSDLFFGNHIIRVHEVLVVRDNGVAMVELWIYDRRYEDGCVGTGSNVNIPVDAICCNGMATQVPTCPGGASLQCFDREIYCDGTQVRSRYVKTTLPTCDVDGVVYTAGDSFPAGDGCNTCTCRASGVICTMRACHEPVSCESDADCPPIETCIVSPCTTSKTESCVGTCEPKGCEYNGKIIPYGGSAPAGDGCNTCTCSIKGVICTTIACSESTEEAK